MANFVPLLKTSELPRGAKKTVFVAGKRIMVANVDGKFFAIDDSCTHAGCSLGTEGFLDGNVITCGCHGGQFDVTSGKVLALPPTADEGTYEIKIEGDSVMVAV